MYWIALLCFPIYKAKREWSVFKVFCRKQIRTAVTYFMCIINVGEVPYIVEREKGSQKHMKS
jgi:hypothetical protein